jgi:hypothetical protein
MNVRLTVLSRMFGCYRIIVNDLSHSGALGHFSGRCVVSEMVVVERTRKGSVLLYPGASGELPVSLSGPIKQSDNPYPPVY